MRVWTIRVTTKPSTAKCDLNTYTLFLLAQSKYPGCTRLADIMEDLSHDSVNRFLLRERYEPKDLFDEVKPYIKREFVISEALVILRPVVAVTNDKHINFYLLGV